jgi:hypothetical protein
MWNTGPVQIQAILYIHTNIYRTCTPKEGLVKETKGGGKGGSISNNNEIIVSV